ncbi:MAG: flavin prenyltransferase UbiX [Synechococcus sp.]
MHAASHPIVIGVTGASGLIYAVRTVRALLASNCQVELVASRAAYRVWQAEHTIQMPNNMEAQAEFWRQQAGGVTSGQLVCHPGADVAATIASGSFRTQGMVVIPSSMGTIAKLAAGMSTDLLERVADVHIKEGRRLVVVPRETPFSLIHLRNLTTLAEAGVRIVPAIPAWYHQPRTIEDLVDFVVARALDQLDIDLEVNLIQRWSGPIDSQTATPQSD